MRHHVDVLTAAAIVAALLLLTHAAQRQPDVAPIRPAQQGTTSEVAP